MRKPKVPKYGGSKVGIPGVERSSLALNHGRRERKFWMQRRSAKNRHSNARTPAETKIRELSGRKSPQKRAIRRRAGNVRFAETGWWARQGSNCDPYHVKVVDGQFLAIAGHTSMLLTYEIYDQNRIWSLTAIPGKIILLITSCF